MTYPFKISPRFAVALATLGFAAVAQAQPAPASPAAIVQAQPGPASSPMSPASLSSGPMAPAPVSAPGPVSASSASASASPAPTSLLKPGNPDESVGPIILRDESIDQVLTLLERWTGKTILRPQALPTTTLTLTLKGGVTREEAVRALETLLSLNGIAITPLDDKFLKITPLANAKSEAPELIDGSSLGLPASGRVVSKIFQLKFLRVAEIIPQVTALLGAGNAPVIFEKANATLITDALTNIQRVEVLLTRLDQPRLAGLEPRFYSLHFAKASEVVTKMHAILSGPLDGQIGTATTYNPDDRTNQIILIADPRQQVFFDELIAKLDVRADPNTRNEVIYLKHATAKDVATVLSQLVQGQNTVTKAASTDNVTRAAGPAPAAAPNAPPAPVASVSSAVSTLAAGGGSNQFSSLLTILPDDRTNSLIVSGTVDDLRLITDLVSKVDILLAQVRIEVVVAEVGLRDQTKSGIDALGLQLVGSQLVGISGIGSGTVVGGQSTNGGSVANGFLALAGAGSLSGIVNLATNPRKSNSTILSQPTITTTHNKESTLFVGETIPTITGSTSSNASIGASNPYTTSSITQQEVGITVTVKPLIGTDGSVQLDIKIEISDVGDPVTIDGNVQNIILKRKTDQFITAQSGEIIVLGGLQRKSNLKGTSRLGPIPYLGDLLGTRTNDSQRTELIFFLRPTVLTNTPADNLSALQQVEQMPKAPRTDVKEMLQGMQPPAPPAKAP
jgi:general secretion pathway protein D